MSKHKQLLQLLQALTPGATLRPSDNGIELSEHVTEHCVNIIRDITLRDIRITTEADGELAIRWIVPIGCDITFRNAPKPVPKRTRAK